MVIVDPSTVASLPTMIVVHRSVECLGNEEGNDVVDSSRDKEEEQNIPEILTIKSNPNQTEVSYGLNTIATKGV